MHAQTITSGFGSGTNYFEIEFVKIGNPGNAADDTGLGAVAYNYNIGKYEVSREMIIKANSEAGLGIDFTYFSAPNWDAPKMPAGGITWHEAARFVNYLNTSQGHQAAYNFDSNGAFQNWGTGQYNGSNQFRHKDAVFFLPSADEWYKAAFFDPNKQIGGGYYIFATGSDVLPVPTSGGTDPGSAVYGGQPGPAEIDNAGGLSPYGTMAQSGNFWEWVESANNQINDDPTENRELHGGAWGSTSEAISKGSRGPNPPDFTLDGFGFRVASVPEPSALSLLVIGLGLFLKRRRTTV